MLATLHDHRWHGLRWIRRLSRLTESHFFIRSRLPPQNAPGDNRPLNRRRIRASYAAGRRFDAVRRGTGKVGRGSLWRDPYFRGMAEWPWHRCKPKYWHGSSGMRPPKDHPAGRADRPGQRDGPQTSMGPEWGTARWAVRRPVSYAADSMSARRRASAGATLGSARRRHRISRPIGGGLPFSDSGSGCGCTPWQPPRDANGRHARVDIPGVGYPVSRR